MAGGGHGRLLLSAFCMILTLGGSSSEPDAELADRPKTAYLGCHKRLFTYRVSQTDSKGRECWDHVSVLSCWGRCDSNEISDWRFPYKRSHHPVCVHAGRTKAVALLRHCHPDADLAARQYEYMEPKSCNCQREIDRLAERERLRDGLRDILRRGVLLTSRLSDRLLATPPRFGVALERERRSRERERL
uniref:Glycoprotein hormone subunit beta domain-containing protein n=1 Tax=Anopheles culicifacies TaxID=139723 RepID=A0A182MA44_9DIPT